MRHYVLLLLILAVGCSKGSRSDQGTAPRPVYADLAKVAPEGSQFNLAAHAGEKFEANAIVRGTVNSGETSEVYIKSDTGVEVSLSSDNRDFKPPGEAQRIHIYFQVYGKENKSLVQAKLIRWTMQKD